MAIKNKFIHFKTRAAFNANVPNPALTADEGNAFYNYTTFIKDTKEIYTHGTFYKCNISEEEVEALVTSKGYITEDDIPVLSGGAAATSGQYVSGVTVSGHTVTVTKDALPKASTEAPKPLGSAAWGTSTDYARADHVHPNTGNILGNAGSATKLANSRVIAIAGAVSGSATFDGSSNVSINSTLNNFDASKITSGTLSADRLPEIPISKLPAGALERMFIMDTETAAINDVMAGTIQDGDVVQIGDGGLMYFCVNDKATTFSAAFKEFTAGSATSVPWSGITGKPSTFIPSTHTQSYTTLTGSTTTANQAIVSNGTANGWTLKTLGSLAFSSATIPTKTSQLTNDSGFLTSAPAQSWASITGKPTFATVATSGSYNDLTNKPTIPSAYTLPTASASTLGGVKIGSGISISSGVISATYSSVGAAAASHTHTASQVTGLADVATSGSYSDLTDKPTIPSLSGYATQSWVTSQGYLTSIPAATRSTVGGIKLGTSSSQYLAGDGKFYIVQFSELSGAPDMSLYVTGSGITGYLAKFTSGTSINSSGIALGTDTTKFLRNDGEWVVPASSFRMSISGNGTIDTSVNELELLFTGGLYVGDITDNKYSISIYQTSTSQFGAVKIGNNISVSSGTISLSKSNVTSALGYTPSSPLIQTGTITNNTITAGYAYDVSSAVVNMVSGFSESNPDAVVATASKITSFPSECSVMDGIMDLNGSVYVYCFTYIGGTVYINGAVYA